MYSITSVSHRVILVWVLILTVTTASSEDFPNRPLTMMIGFNPGGSTDIQAKVLAPILAEKLGQPVELLHQAGAGGGVAAAMLANSREGGYIFQYGLSTPYTLSPLTTRTSYNVNSFRYLVGITLDQSAFVTGADSPFHDWAGFIAYAKAHPHTLYATQTELDRLIIHHIAQKEGFSLRIIPTTGGAGMAPLILSGDALIAYSGGTHSAYTDSGKMRVLAGLADERLRYYPDVPTVRELGYDVSMHAVRVVAVPKDTSDDQADRLTAAFAEAIQDPRFIAVTEQTIRMPVVFLDEQALNALFARQVAEYQRLLVEEQK
jgi:tripartite-type tricarboxylate transporter receptor subunit TctC